MNPQKPSNPNQIIGGLAAVLIIIGVGGTYQFLRPKLQLAAINLGQAKAQDEGLQTDITTLQHAQTQIETAKQALATKGVDFTTLSSVYPPSEEIPTLYIQMENLMTLTPNVVASYQIAPPVSTTPTDVRVPISVTATANYADLKTFITTLENNVRPITITSLSFGPSATKDKDGKPIVGTSSLLSLNVAGYVRAQAISAAYSAPKK